GDHQHAVAVEPAPRDVGADLRLVLVIGRDDLDRLAEHALAEILGRHLGGDDRALAAEIGIGAALVAEHADLDRFGLRRGRAGEREGERRRGETGSENAHDFLPLCRATVRAAASCRTWHGTGRGGRKGREISAWQAEEQPYRAFRKKRRYGFLQMESFTPGTQARLGSFRQSKVRICGDSGTAPPQNPRSATIALNCHRTDEAAFSRMQTPAELNRRASVTGPTHFRRGTTLHRRLILVLAFVV